MIFLLNSFSPPSRNFISIGRAYVFCFTLSLSASVCRRRVLSFSVVMIIFGEGSASNSLFMRSSSAGVN